LTRRVPGLFFVTSSKGLYSRLALLLVRFWVLHLQVLAQSLAQWPVLVRPPLPDW
jgi:hypothetical protein